MQQAQSEGLLYDPFLETSDSETNSKNQEILERVAAIGSGSREGYEKNVNFYKNFVTTFGIDYCPVYSVIGSIVSQEIIKIAESIYVFI